jgi:LmbE family N-acetylglucosaminyl deacetylase
MRKLLAFFAHPDDETFAAGGLIAFAARHGARVEVISATRGEHGADRGKAASPGSLGATRAHELGVACRLLGAEDPRFLGLADGAVDPNGAAAALAPLLAETAPDLIVTFGADGAYGHRDHLACTDAVTRLTPLAPVLHAVFPRGVFAPLCRALGRFDIVSLSPDRIGVDREAVDLILPLDDALQQQKRQALGAHLSQLDEGDPRSFLQPGLIDPLLREEWYVLAAGDLPTEVEALAAWFSV